MPAAAERILIVEARNLDTDERTVVRFEVEMPTDDARQRVQLAGVVAGLHPDARMRSFGGGAASFLDSQRLVVAHYAVVDERTPVKPADRIARIEQQPLFVT